MPRTLYAKLALILLALLSLLGALFLFANLLSTRLFLREVNQDLHRDLAAQLVAESLPLEDGEIQPEALEHIFHMLMVINPAIEVYLLDPEGALLAYSAPAGTVVRESVSLEPVHRFLSATQRLPVLGEDPRDLARRKVFSAAVVGASEAPEGYLYVILGGELYDSAVAMIAGSHILRLGVGASLAALLFALATGLLLFARITRRLRRLATGVESFRQSGFTELPAFAWSAQSGRNDEIDRLGGTFQEMAGQMSDQLAELKKTDELRRELVANVSHDLRTPITSLHGYLETLHVKADSLSEAERRDYLETALKHSERLSELVSELFELARLESCATDLEIEPVPLAELVQDAIQHFRLDAEVKQIDLRADLPKESRRVEVDVGLISRALDNLLDNALRYTPAGGRVTVGLHHGDETLRVEIEDTGPGIAPENLPHLFDRFFHHPAGTSDHGGTGLGLAIAQKALELHGSAIEVESSPGKGSRFAFELSVHAS